MSFDMATSVQAWGKTRDMRSWNENIPDSWAVDSKSKPTTNLNDICGVMPISGLKGYGLMMILV